MASVARKRTLTQAPLLCALAAVVAVLAIVLTGVHASFNQTQDEAVAEAVAQGPATAAAAQVAAEVEAPAEADAAKKTADRISKSAPTTVTHRLAGDSFTADDGRIYLAATVPDLAQHADIVDGQWATTDREASVQADSGLRVGDTVAVRDIGLKVVGTWRVKDASDPRWFAEPSMLSGADRDAIGPLIVTRRTLDALPIYVEEQWTIVPRSDGLGTEEIQSLASELGRVLADDQPGVEIRGQLLERADSVNRSIKAGRGLEVVAMSVLGLVGVVTMLQLLGLLGDARQRESDLLRARGASVPQVARWHGLDVAITAIIAATVAAGLVAVTIGEPSWLLATGAAVPAVILGPIFAARRARHATAHVARESSVTLGGIAVLACAAAALTITQFLTYGSAITTRVDGRPAVDPLTVLAPALTLVAGALLGAVAMGPLAIRAARHAADREGLTMVMAFRQIARRPRTFGVLVALSAVVVGNTLTASAYAATSRSLDERVSIAAVGADIRVELNIDNASAADSTSLDAKRFANLPGVKAVVPGIGGTGRIGETDVPFLAIEAADLDVLVKVGALNSADLRKALSTKGGGTGAVITESLAAALNLHVDDIFDVALPNGIGEVTARVRKVVRVVPGLPTDGGMLVNTAAIQRALARADRSPAEPSTFLLSADNPHATARAAAAASTHTANITVATSDAVLVRSAANTWVYTTIGIVVLGLIGIIAVAVALVRRRSVEVRILRALGLPTSGQRRARLAEIGAAIAAGGLVGVLTSILVVATTVPGLARASRASDAPNVPLDLKLDLPLLAIAVGIAAAGLAMAGTAYRRAVSRQATELVRGEVT